VFAVLQFPGSNDDRDLRFAVKSALGAEARLVWHKEPALPADTRAVLLPGGFSYGDYLRCGAMARFSPVMAAVKRFADAGGPVFGTCNGFQVLCESGLLPGALLAPVQSASADDSQEEAPLRAGLGLLPGALVMPALHAAPNLRRLLERLSSDRIRLLALEAPAAVRCDLTGSPSFTMFGAGSALLVAFANATGFASTAPVARLQPLSDGRLGERRP